MLTPFLILKTMIKKLKIKEESKEKIELASDCDKILMEEAAIQVFGEDYVDFTNGGLIIHFPEITIKNRDGQEHEILNLYVQLFWNMSASGELTSFSNYIKGFRTTLTYEEANSNYIHSHLYPMSEFQEGDDEEEGGISLEPSTFCLGGNSDINTILSTLNMEFSLDQYMILLLSLDDFVRWESLDGGPHILLGDIQKFGDSFTEIKNITSNSGSLPITTKKEFYTKLNLEEFKKLTFYPDSVQTILSTKEQFRELVEQTLTLSSFIRPEYDIATKYKDKYYYKEAGISNMVSTIDEQNITSWYPPFKGINLEIEIIQIETEEDIFKEIEEEGLIVPHPIVSNLLLLDIEEDLHKHLNNKDKWKLKK